MANKFDQLHIRFSRIINDPVASEADDGDILTAEDRDGYLNRAIKLLQGYVYTSFSKDEVQNILSSQIKTDSITLSGSGVSLPSDDNAMPLSLIDSTTFYKYYPNRQVLVLGLNADIPAYSIEGSKIYAYDSSGVKTSGSATYTYICKDEGSNGSTTIALADHFLDIVVYLAAAQFSTEVGNMQDVEIFMNNVKLALQGISHE